MPPRAETMTKASASVTYATQRAGNKIIYAGERRVLLFGPNGRRFAPYRRCSASLVSAKGLISQ
jgi:hypothetical protein